MKTILFFFTIILSSFNSFSQSSKVIASALKESNTTEQHPAASFKIIKSFKVKEIINNFRGGGYTTKYEVSNLKIIHIYDLGPNNVRIITPYYIEVKQLTAKQIKHNEEMIRDIKKFDLALTKNFKTESISKSLIMPQLKEEEFIIVAPKKELFKDNTFDNNLANKFINKNKKVIYVDVIKTYERIVEKGYKSADLFQKLGNSYFYSGDYAKAAKWYGELFKMNITVESEYYLHNAHSLKMLNEKENK